MEQSPVELHKPRYGLVLGCALLLCFLLLIMCAASLFVAPFVSFSRPVVDASEYTSAKVAQNGTLVVFTVHHHMFQRDLISYEGSTHDLVNRDYVATYHFQTGETRIVYKQDTTGHYGNGIKGMDISDALGDKVIVSQYGYWNGGASPESREYWLNLDTGGLTPLPIRTELALHNQSLSELHLVDDQGTLAITALPSGEDSQYPSSFQLWVRDPSGRYTDLGQVSDYVTTSGKVYFWSFKTKDMMSYTPATHSQPVPVPQSSASFVRPGFDWEAYKDVKLNILSSPDNLLQVSRRIKGQWQPYQTVPVTIQDVVRLANESS